jgi:hypothetical protein
MADPKHEKPSGQPKPIPLRKGGDLPAQGGKHAGRDKDQDNRGGRK